MAHPKRKHSKQRTRKRRSHDALNVPSFHACSHCGKPILSHRVCPFCGYYKGRPTVLVAATPKKKKGE